MTPEDIERMAGEAGMHNDGQWWFDGDSNAQCDVSTAALARFAALVRAQALEDAARVCESARLEVDAFARAEYNASIAACQCATAIRALGDTK